jgi:transposase InsO family protein
MRYPTLNAPFHINGDLAALLHMIKVMTKQISPKARQRLAWMDAYRESGNAAKVCRHYGIPQRTFWRWKNRYDPWDLSSLEDRSRKPKSSPNKTPRAVEDRVLDLRREHPRWGREKLALLMAREGAVVSGRTCGRVCARRSLSVRYRTRKRRAPKPRVNWAEISLPGDLLELDVKYVRQHGRTYYQFTLVDVVTRWRHAEILASRDMETCIHFLERALRLPPFAVRTVQTDNGGEFGRKVTAWLRARGIAHVFTHKKRPQENGHVERSHRTDEEEFYSVEPRGTNLRDLQERFQRYLAMYNAERPHWALGGKTPNEALNEFGLTNVCHMS